MPHATRRALHPLTLASREPARSTSLWNLAASEPRDPQALLDGVDVTDSTWGEWEQLAAEAGGQHA